MIDLARLEKQLTGEEGRRHDAYLDSLGVPTIGIGHATPDIHLGMTWTDAQIDAAFQADVTEKSHQIAAAFPWAMSLCDPRTAVLIEMCFQMGLDGLIGFHQALGAMRDGRFDDAAAQMLASKWDRQTPERAKSMADQMRSGEWQS